MKRGLVASQVGDYRVKKYYDILEVPPTATQEQIKSQYKQLVRVYHPDRFANSEDKDYAEHKLKEINDAYRILIRGNSHATIQSLLGQGSNLKVEPARLDFGALPRNSEVARRFQVTVVGGYPRDIDFAYSEEESWFQIVKVSHLYKHGLGPIEFEVEANTTSLSLGIYEGWIDVNIDSLSTRIMLNMRVVRVQYRLPPRLLFALSTILFGVVLFLGLPLFTSLSLLEQTSAASSSVSITGPTESLKLQRNQLLFSLVEAGKPTIYVASIQGMKQHATEINGWAPAGAIKTQRLAYLSDQDGSIQVYWSDLQTGQVNQVTESLEPKSNLVWSPDGQKLAFLQGQDQKMSLQVVEIVDAQANIEEKYQLPEESTEGAISNFAWSPNSRSLIFDQQQDEKRYVFIANYDGTTIQQLTEFESWNGAWSPSGRELIVSSMRGILKLDPQGKELQQLTKSPAIHPSWSASGSYIAYQIDNRDQAESELWVMGIDGKNQSLIAKAENIQYTWAPVGSLLAYRTGNPNSEPALLYLWTITIGSQPSLLAELNSPDFGWIH